MSQVTESNKVDLVFTAKVEVEKGDNGVVTSIIPNSWGHWCLTIGGKEISGSNCGGSEKLLAPSPPVGAGATHATSALVDKAKVEGVDDEGAAALATKAKVEGVDDEGAAALATKAKVDDEGAAALATKAKVEGAAALATKAKVEGVDDEGAAAQDIEAKLEKIKGLNNEFAINRAYPIYKIEGDKITKRGDIESRAEEVDINEFYNTTLPSIQLEDITEPPTQGGSKSRKSKRRSHKKNKRRNTKRRQYR
jgi:hypothetical protein